MLFKFRPLDSQRFPLSYPGLRTPALLVQTYGQYIFTTLSSVSGGEVGKLRTSVYTTDTFLYSRTHHLLSLSTSTSLWKATWETN